MNYYIVEKFTDSFIPLKGVEQKDIKVIGNLGDEVMKV